MREFSVLLVDDEEPALEGLEKGVDWKKVGISKIYKCHSKDTAIRMLKTYSIDMVVTDIEMPGGSGIELIRWVRENNPCTESVFIQVMLSSSSFTRHFVLELRIIFLNL